MKKNRKVKLVELPGVGIAQLILMENVTILNIYPHTGNMIQITDSNITKLKDLIK